MKAQPQYIVNTKQDELLKESYIRDINTLMRSCNDISLLDLLKKLLEKSI